MKQGGLKDNGPAEAAPEAPAPNAGGRSPEVSVVIPHYDDLTNLRRCLSLLAAQSLERDRYEVIVADNNSRCGFEAVAAVCGDRARLVPAPIQGASEARNAGVRASRGRVLAFIDSDCRPAREWLENGLLALEAADMAGGAVDVDLSDEANPTAVEAFEKVFAFNFKRYIEKEKFSGSGNMFVSRRIFDHVGGFRNGVSEDKDWSHRAVALGYQWRFAPEARVSHPARREWEELTRKWRRTTAESYHLLAEKPFGRARWLARAWLVLLSPLVHTFVVLRSPKLKRAEQKASAIFVLFRLRWWRFLECHRIWIADARLRRRDAG